MTKTNHDVGIIYHPIENEAKLITEHISVRKIPLSCRPSLKRDWDNQSIRYQCRDTKILKIERNYSVFKGREQFSRHSSENLQEVPDEKLKKNYYKDGQCDTEEYMH